MQLIAEILDFPDSFSIARKSFVFGGQNGLFSRNSFRLIGLQQKRGRGWGYVAFFGGCGMVRFLTDWVGGAFCTGLAVMI